ncbi:MAG TPA: MBL fold metallo-hydrolase [Candidatus Micrarchaeaceae archaeon]|nr:MBL fold metallo-hydrolase [Candidatus Micrarchaeaceae archaeon]
MAASGAWREIADSVWVTLCPPFLLNVGLIVGPRRALVIDTGESLATGRELATLVREVTHLPLGAVNTHCHFDHCFGNGAFDSAQVWCHRLCAEHLQKEGEEQRREVAARIATTDRDLAERIRQSPIIAPTRLIDDQLQLDLGGRIVTLVHPGRGHTDNDVVVWVDDARVLFAGDLVEEGAPPSFEESFPLEWPATLGVLLAMDADQIIPGHGLVVDVNFTRQLKDDLLQLANLSRQGFESSRRPADIAPQSPFPGNPGQTAIRRAYGQLAQAAAELREERKSD